MNETSIGEGQQPLAIIGRAGLSSRYLKDRLAKAVVRVGGLGVIGALLLIFVYLLSEVAPLFSVARVDPRRSFATPGDGSPTLYLGAEEQGEIGLRVGASGEVVFFDLFDGQTRLATRLPVGDASLVSVTELSAEHGTLAAALSDGRVLTFRHTYPITYAGNQRLITPRLTFEDGETPLAFLEAAPRALAAREEYNTLALAAIAADGGVTLKTWSKTTSLLGDATLTESVPETIRPAFDADLLLMEPLLSWLYVIDRESGRIELYRLSRGHSPRLEQTVEVGGPLVDARYLAGGISIVVAERGGELSQWFPSRDARGNWRLARVRNFDAPGEATLTALGAETRRRGFAVGDERGGVSMYYATSGRRVFDKKLLSSPVERLAFNPRARALVALGADGRTTTFDVRNEHPEVSLSALWSRVWYESYDEPRFLWQSSSASSDFEPKFSLTPLAIGTLKGAFYAMIFAVPLAVLGAIFTANFMSPEMRQVVKPAVEVLAALPSVVLGFLAGLWLAPFIETNLPGMFLTLLLLPVSIPIFGFLWTRLPRSVRLRVPQGWEAAILMPVIVVVVGACFALAKPVEALFFAGNMQAWMDHELGIGYDQRNALVVGIAMGIAVIPIIFSIAEDAIFSVPQHLSLGSLALGATPWQTLIGVVLPTASPGIFSAIMIGLGRAVGETMIVLMATGNTPVVDFSVFSGMRTLAANIAVEMPESAVGSTHFRLLFLAGLTLFVITLLFNTLAEVVRGRLREKYGSL